MIKNVLLATASILVVIVLSVLADRLVGLLAPAPGLPGTMELLFPPHSEQTFETADFRYTAHINSLGLRDREFPTQRTDAYRIIAIGDSYTYGWGVEIEETWLRVLEENLEREGLNVETMNLGKPGTGPPAYAELAERAIPILWPDLVIVAMLQANDLAASGPEGLEDVKDSLLDKVGEIYPNIVRMIRDRELASVDPAQRKTQMPPHKSTAEDNRRACANTAKDFLDKMTPEQRARFDKFDDEVKQAYHSGNLNPYMIDLAMQNENFYTFTLQLDDPWIKDCIERMAGQLRRIKKAAKAYNARVVVLSIPDGPYVNRHAHENIQRVGYKVTEDMLTSDGPDRAIQIACKQAGLPFYQATQAFKDRMDDGELFYKLDSHITAAGHRLYAERITPILKEVIGGAAR